MEQIILNGICRGAAYGVIAAGFGLIFSAAGVFHIAHAAVCAVAAYTAYAMINWLGGNVFLACFAGIIISSLVGIIIEKFVYQPIRNQGAPPTALLVASLAVLLIITNTLALCFGEEPLILLPTQIPTIDLKVLLNNYPSLLHIFPQYLISSEESLVLNYAQIAQFLSLCFIWPIYWLLLRYSRFGLLASSVAQDPSWCTILGIRTDRIRIIAFAIGSALGGLGFTMIVLDTGVDPHSGMTVTITAAIACIIVGANRLVASMPVGLILGMVQSVLIWYTSAIWASSFTYLLMIFMLVFMPKGLLIRKERFEES